MFVRHRTNTANSYFDAGWSFTSTPRVVLNTRNTEGKVQYAINSGTVTTSTNTIPEPRKVICVNRPDAATQQVYVDGALFDSAAVTGGGLVAAGPFKVGASLGNRWSGRDFSVFGFGASLTATEHQALRDAIENYMTAVGA